MNVITYNVRGLGRGVKWAAIRRMVKKHRRAPMFMECGKVQIGKEGH